MGAKFYTICIKAQTQKITRYTQGKPKTKNLTATHKSSLNCFLRPSLDAKLFMSQT